MIKYVNGDVSEPIGEGRKLIIQCVNNLGIMGAGVARAIMIKWPIVRQRYIAWSLERNYFSPDDCKLPNEALLNMALYFSPPNKEMEGDWFDVIECKNAHKRKIPFDKRIKIDKHDNLFSILEKWRALWDVAHVKNENKNF